MKIGIGRRQLVVSLVDSPRGGCVKAIDIPAAVNATDAELAHLNALHAHMLDRATWESGALLYGSARLRA